MSRLCGSEGMAPRSIIAELISTWRADPAGRVLIGAWAATFFGVSARAFYLRKRARAAVKATPPEEKTQLAITPEKRPTPFKRVLRLAFPSWSSRQMLWGGVLTAGIGLRLLVAIKMNTEIGVLGALLSKRNWPILFRRQLSYALWAIPASLLAALQGYAAAQVSQSMRHLLTSRVHHGYAQCKSLAVALNNSGEAVQRGLLDSKAFCEAAVQLYESLTKPLVEVTLLSVKLGSMMGGTQLVQCYGFFFLAGSWTRFVGPSIASMSAHVQAAEGKLLAHHSQVNEYAEEIALCKGGAAAGAAFDSALCALSASSARLSAQRLCSESLDQYVVRYLGILAAFTAMLPAVASGSHAVSDPTEYFLTCLHLLVNVGLAIKDLFGAAKALATARAMAARVSTLLDALDAAAADTAASISSSAAPLAYAAGNEAAVQMCSFGVAPPSGQAMFSGVNLSLPQGARLLVRGPNGAGKSSLLRTLLGLWPAAAGRAHINVRPEEVLALPQRPYMPMGASLKEGLLYPATKECALWATSDEQLIEALRFAGIEHLLPAGVSPSAAPLPHGLSGGEQQRVAAARLYLHEPVLALLDEPTANCEPGFERHLFALCARRGTTLITVSHDRSLGELHTHELVLDGEGSYEMRTPSMVIV